MPRSAQETNLILRLGADPFDTKFDSDEPVEYILGKAEFRGSIFTVNNNVLIPRIETEEIIDIALEYLNDNTELSSGISFADVATGSGAIGISFARELEERNVIYKGFLSDISHDALEVANSNLSILNTGSNLKVIKSDLLNEYPSNIKFNIIFANLPYIPTSRIDTLDSSVKNYEPILALDGGEDGLDLIKKLILNAKQYIAENGVLILEVDDLHTKDIADALNLGVSIKARNDQFGKNRFWVVQY